MFYFLNISKSDVNTHNTFWPVLSCTHNVKCLNAIKRGDKALMLIWKFVVKIHSLNEVSLSSSALTIILGGL